MKKPLLESSGRKKPMGDDTKYSRAINVPQYTPSNSKPNIYQLMQVDKYTELLKHIEESNVSDLEKQFLRLAATRHIVFNYGKIADYYANSESEMQNLMEQSALVILDMDDAIAQGFVKLSDKMKQLVEEEKARDFKARESGEILKKQRKLMNKKAKESPTVREDFEKNMNAPVESELDVEQVINKAGFKAEPLVPVEDLKPLMPLATFKKKPKKEKKEEKEEKEEKKEETVVEKTETEGIKKKKGRKKKKKRGLL